MSTQASEVLVHLERVGILLKQDKRLPNVVTILTGETVSGSWWSHPKAQMIFRTLSELAEHPDVLITKLLFGKDTLVHRSLWPAFLAVATADEPWQHKGLSQTARSLLSRVHHSAIAVRSPGSPVKELVTRLLVHAVEVHTESGKHEMAVESWDGWAKQSGVRRSKSIARSRKTLESLCQAIGAPLTALPWS